MSDVRWLVRSPQHPDMVVPVQNEQAANELIAGYRKTARRFRSRVLWEYGFHLDGVPNSYHKVGPR